MDCIAKEGHIDVSVLGCFLRPCKCPWSKLPPRGLSRSVVLLQLGTMSVVLLSPETTWKTMVCARTDSKGQRSDFAVVAMVAHIQLRDRNME